MGSAWKAAASRGAALIGLLCALLAVYLLIRPSQLHWGATRPEIHRAMPEDGIVPHPAFDATRAITIRARPDDIWPWLAQMGYGRAGFYGYDLIENPGGGAGLRSADRILPQWQHPRTGDSIPISVAATLVYGTVDPGHCIVWRANDTPPSGVYIWQLVPIDATHTRLISRIRWNYLHDPLDFVLGLFTEFADHVAVRAILRGIRDRVEGRPPKSLVAQGIEIGAWLFTGFDFGFAALLILFARRWHKFWLFALAAGLLLDFELYATPPAAVAAALPVLLLGLMVRTLRRERLHTRPVDTPLVNARS